MHSKLINATMAARRLPVGGRLCMLEIVAPLGQRAGLLAARGQAARLVVGVGSARHFSKDASQKESEGESAGISKEKVSKPYQRVQKNK